MTIGEIILAVVNFLIYPTWHLVVLYVLIFVAIIWSMLKSWPGIASH